MLHDKFIEKGLSLREIEIAQEVIKGKTNKEAANNLFITEKTVKFHLTNIYRKMSLATRSQLIVWSIPHMDFKEEKLPVGHTEDKPAEPQI